MYTGATSKLISISTVTTGAACGKPYATRMQFSGRFAGALMPGAGDNQQTQCNVFPPLCAAPAANTQPKPDAGAIQKASLITHEDWPWKVEEQIQVSKPIF